MHEWSTIYKSPTGGAKMLNFYGGPVVSHLISVAPKCKEVMFADFSADCREQVDLWLKKDPSAFDWWPYFSYVVHTLEGGTETQPLDDIGPYDIIFTSLCLECVYPTNDSYRESVAKLAHLLKPGGTLLIQGAENHSSLVHNDVKVKVNPVSRELTCKSLESAGLTLITMDILPIASWSTEIKEIAGDSENVLIVVATKQTTWSQYRNWLNICCWMDFYHIFECNTGLRKYDAIIIQCIENFDNPLSLKFILIILSFPYLIDPL